MAESDHTAFMHRYSDLGYGEKFAASHPKGNGSSPSSFRRSTWVGIRKEGLISCMRQMIGVKAKRPRFKEAISRDKGGKQSFRTVGFRAIASVADSANR